MKKKLLFFLFTFGSLAAFSQAPYIGSGSGEGIGQYGFLEKDAITFARLYRNTYSNVRNLSLEMKVGASANVYYPTSGAWQCSGDNSASQTTNNYSAADFGSEWVAGASVTASVTSKYCDNSLGGPFNARHFNIIDVAASANSIASSFNTMGCFKKVIGAFTVDPGAYTSNALNDLVINISGVAETALGNAIYLYYEPYTGSEVFNNNESSATLYGDWGGDANNNGNYKSAGMNIALSSKTTFYLVVCINAAVQNQSVTASIINDGIWLKNANDSYTMMRIDPTTIGSSVVLPVTFISFSGLIDNNTSILKWTVGDESNVLNYVLEKTTNGFNYYEVATVNAVRATNYSAIDNNPDKGDNFYRIKVVDNDGKIAYSSVLKLYYGKAVGALQVYPMPASDKINIRMSAMEKGTYNMSLTDVNGRVVMLTKLNYNVADIPVCLPANIKAGVYILKLNDGSQNWIQKVIVQ